MACTLDYHPRFYLEALRWYATATEVAGVSAGDLRVSIVGSPRGDVIDYLRDRGVGINLIQQFDARSPHCNKISGAVALAADPPGGTCILTDADVVLVEDPRTIVVPDGYVGMKPVDTANPPLATLKAVFAAAGVPEPAEVAIDHPAGASTLEGNGNGGMCIVLGSTLPALARAWSQWATWLLDRLDLLGAWAVHVDQVSMALALAAEGIGVLPLDTSWNIPIHSEELLPKTPLTPKGIHYHQHVDSIGQIALTGHPWIDEVVSRANAATARVWKEGFPNSTFWDWRYLTNPALGSGVGSRDAALTGKREILEHVLDVIGPLSVLDVGCGDGEATQDLDIAAYTGIDVSEESIRVARSTRADGRYLCGTVAEYPVTAELVLCLDVLIHQPSRSGYRDLLERVVKSSTRALLVSGYERPPSTTSPMVHFHEPLTETLQCTDENLELYPVRDVHDISTVLALRPPEQRHPRDFTAATLRQLVDQHPSPLLLADIRRSAWDTTGFYPDHAPRLWEYPVVANLISEHLPVGATLMDVGPGVNPLVPYLTRKGFVVDTVDPGAPERIWPPRPDWNEWGYLDYATAGLARDSWRTTLDQVPC